VLLSASGPLPPRCLYPGSLLDDDRNRGQACPARWRSSVLKEYDEHDGGSGDVEAGILVRSFFHHVSSHSRTPIYRVLVCLDLMANVGLGRPCAIQDNESVSHPLSHRLSTSIGVVLTSTFQLSATMSIGSPWSKMKRHQRPFQHRLFSNNPSSSSSQRRNLR